MRRLHDPDMANNNRSVYKYSGPFKVGDHDPEVSDGCYIYSAEAFTVPGFPDAVFRIDFQTGDSAEEIDELLTILKKKGFSISIQ